MSQHQKKNIGEQRRQFLRVLQKVGSHAVLGQVYVHRLGQEMGMNSVGFQKDRAELAELACELEEAGYVRGSGGRYAFYGETKPVRDRPESTKETYGYYELTDEGKRNIEEE